MPKALVITVTYRSVGCALEFLASLQRDKAFAKLEFILVDNSSGEELVNVRDVMAQLDNCQLLESPHNRGYFGSAIFAFDHYMAQRHLLPDWVIVCNPDVLIEDTDFLSKLFGENPETVGVIGPRIQALPGRADQNPFMRRRPGWLRWAYLQSISSNYAAAVLWSWLAGQKAEFRSRQAARRRAALADREAKRESIYAAHGSFLIFSRRYFEAGGFLDGNLFLYGEEISVAEICRSLGLPIVYEPSLRVIHNPHQSTGKVLCRFTYECQKNAIRYVTSRYFSGSQALLGSCH